VIFHRREFSKRIGATVELSLRGSHHPSLKNYTGLDISQGRDKKICGTTFRETLNKSTFCGEPAQLCDAGCWKIKGLA
jgi:hypothetical protein